jgi:hypothetical protein
MERTCSSAGAMASGPTACCSRGSLAENGLDRRLAIAVEKLVRCHRKKRQRQPEIGARDHDHQMKRHAPYAQAVVHIDLFQQRRALQTQVERVPEQARVRE